MNTKRKTIQQAASDSGLPTTLINSVIRQIGGADALEDVYNHGADAGFPGFTYYNDTVSFYRRHRKAIVTHLETQADEFGEGLMTMLQSFRCLKEEDGQFTGCWMAGSVTKASPSPTAWRGMPWRRWLAPCTTAENPQGHRDVSPTKPDWRNPMTKSIYFTSGTVPMMARIVEDGDYYGLHGCLAYEHTDPMIEFFDRRFDQEAWLGEKCQFISRYYVSTFLEIAPGQGLNLYGGVTDWQMDGEVVTYIKGAIKDYYREKASEHDK